MIQTVDTILALVLLSVLFSFGSSRLPTLIKILAFQGVVVSIVPLFIGHDMTTGGMAFTLMTLAIRVRQQAENAFEMAKFLDGQPVFKKVYYPGLPDHPGHQVACGQMRGFGAMVSFELDHPDQSAERFMKNLKLIKPAVSLGGVETTICDPARTSHAKVSAEVRSRQGITDNLFRLSVGIENIDDLVKDVKQAAGI